MCIFCQIVKGEIPCYKVYEDDDFIAFLDISQATVGHTLIVPKIHVENIFSLPLDLQKKLAIVINLVSNQLKKTLSISNLNILNNNGPLAGQTVSHFHVHLLPRYADDDLQITFASHQISSTEFITLQQKILAKS